MASLMPLPWGRGFRHLRARVFPCDFPMAFVVSHTHGGGEVPVHYGNAEDGLKTLYILGKAAATERHPRLLKGLFLVRTLEVTSAFHMRTEVAAETRSLQVRLCFTATFPEDSGKNIACCLVLLKNTVCMALSLLSTETSKCHRRNLLATVRPCGGGEEHSFTKQHTLGKVTLSLNQGQVDAIYSEKQTLTGRN